MEIDITIKNYRCFTDENPATISIRNGYTAFIGVNNAGKSTLLRFFYEFRDLFLRLSNHFSSKKIDEIGRNTFQFSFVSRNNEILDFTEFFSNTNDRKLEIAISFKGIEAFQDIPPLEKLVLSISRQGNASHPIVLMEHRVGSQKFVLHSIDVPNQIYYFKTEDMSATSQINVAEVSKTFQQLSNTLYIGSFRNVINVGTNENYFDIQIGQAFVQAWRAMKSGNTKSDNEVAYKLTQEIKNIFGYSDFEINDSQDGTTLKIRVNGKSYRLSELGSGLAQFIIVLANAAIKKPSYILIDEPELNLHPALQQKFLETIGSYASEGVMFATHSIGLARSTADRIYSISKDKSGSSIVKPYEATANLSMFLGEMSYSGYQELGFSKVLLVEGVTDIRVIQQFLRRYKKEHEVVLMHLGGKDFINAKDKSIELQEFKRIVKNVSALIDSEKDDATTPKRNREEFKETCRLAGINCHILERRATENYFSDRAIKRVLGISSSALQPYEKFIEKSNWKKEKNWLIAREMTEEELDETDLGQFLKSL
jgi:predicted ATP-dependent endonuclease of OLD family